MIHIKHGDGHYTLEYTFNGKVHHWYHQYILGAELRDIFSIPADNDIFLSVVKPWKDEHIQDDTKVDLAREGVEHFYSKPKNPAFTIIVNGTPHSWNKHKISFEEVVALAYGAYDSNPNIRYTVHYSKGPDENPKGAMEVGDEVFVTNKMEFSATKANKS